MKKGFEKFIDKKPKGAKKREILKQEKRAVKKEREEFFINKKREERKAKKEAFEQKEAFEKARLAAKKTVIVKKEVTAEESDTKKRRRIYADKAAETAKAGRKSYFKTKEEITKELVEKQTAKKAALVESKTITKGSVDKKTDTKKAPIVRKAIDKELLAKPALNNPILKKNEKNYEQIPLNKYVAHSGVSSRREAAELIKNGKIKVNNKLVIEPGYKVQENDTVTFEGKTLKPEGNLVYILINKPKDFLTTSDDPTGRKTVMDLVAKATSERVYPVGRLDRNTTGVLLITNDGELAQKLTHPKNEIKKVYEAKLDKPLTKADFEKIMEGLQLEDGFIAPDALAYVDNNDKTVIGIEIHSGKNRIVRRIFEHLQYDVKGLDRVMFAGLTKKNVERGRYRFLSEKEIRNLKYLNASKANKGIIKK